MTREEELESWGEGGENLMHFYFGWNGHADTLSLLRECGVSRMLVSYAILRDHAEGRWPSRADLSRLADMDILVDSGAFSAFRSGKPVTLDEYRAFLDMSRPERYITLDVIGDWQATLHNCRELESAGYAPIPVWHAQDPWELLRDLTVGYPLVALGGLVPLTPTARSSVLRRIFGEHPHDYHGLGIGSPALLRAFPWASCDSSTWDYDSIFWRVQGWPDKWTPRRRHIERILAVEHTWRAPATQTTWSM